MQAPQVQRWILQKVQGAAAEYRGAGSRVRNNGSCRGYRVLLLNAAVQSAVRAAKNPRSRFYKPSTSNLKDPNFSHPTYAGLDSFRGAIAGHQIWQFKKAPLFDAQSRTSCVSAMPSNNPRMSADAIFEIKQIQIYGFKETNNIQYVKFGKIRINSKKIREKNEDHIVKTANMTMTKLQA